MAQPLPQNLTSVTRWRNPTDRPVTFEVMGEVGRFYRVHIKAGESADLPGQYDDAIQTVRDGVVVRGLAPQLVAEGRENLPMHEALAKAAKLGDVERTLLLRGITPGAHSLDDLARLAAKVDDLQKASTTSPQDMQELESLRRENASLRVSATENNATMQAVMTRLAALEAGAKPASDAKAAPAPARPKPGASAASASTDPPAQ